MPSWGSPRSTPPGPPVYQMRPAFRLAKSVARRLKWERTRDACDFRFARAANRFDRSASGWVYPASHRQTVFSGTRISLPNCSWVLLPLSCLIRSGFQFKLDSTSLLPSNSLQYLYLVDFDDHQELA